MGEYPPHGWPLHTWLTLFIYFIYTKLIIIGYLRIFTIFLCNLLQKIIKILNDLLHLVPSLIWKPLEIAAFVSHEAANKSDPSKIVKQVFNTAELNDSLFRKEVFDGNSETAIMDNSANCFIWRHYRDFIPGTYVKLDDDPSNNIKTAMGDGKPVGVGNINIGWSDNDGKYHSFTLLGVNHVPDSPVNVIGIPALSRILGDYNEEGTTITSSGLSSTLSWDRHQFKRKFYHSDASIPEMPVNDGYSNYYKFCNFTDRIQPIDAQCYHNHALNHRISTPILSPEMDPEFPSPYSIGEEVLFKDGDHVERGIIERVTTEPEKSTSYFIKFKNNNSATASVNQLTADNETELGQVPVTPEDFIEQARILDESELSLLTNPLPLNNLQIEWKRIHDKFGHLPFAEMDKLVYHGVLPSKFKSLCGKKIICPSCIFGRMRRRQWRFKNSKGKQRIRKDNQKYPGAKVSTDQLVVAQPGLVPRMDGRHTNDRICGATTFLDHYSGMSYSSLQTSLDGQQTLEAKQAFETHSDSCGVDIKSYRADNGRYAEKSFVDAIKDAHQTIDFCGVGAHHQNGIIERHLQRRTSRSRTILLHAKRHSPAMISTILWPFAFKYAELLYNHLHLDNVGLSPMEKFCASPEKMNLDNLHTWGSPCYVLDERLQGQHIIPKWDPRSQLKIYLGHSPCHAGSVALILNPRTFHVSPQYHIALMMIFRPHPT